MKKLSLFIILGIIACFGANAATASAGNCSNIHTDGIQLTGSDLYYNFVVQGCSGINQVQFIIANGAGQAGLIDVSAGGIMHGAYAMGGAATQSISNNGVDYVKVTYHVGCWTYLYGQNRAAWGAGVYRLHAIGAGSGTWGPWHEFVFTYGGGGQVISCG